MVLFEEGTRLSALLHGMLENAEQKITILTQDKDGSLEEKPLDAEGDAT